MLCGCLIVQQVDGNVIYPNVIGKSLNIHPLTIIIILLVAGKLAGLLGIFLGVPLYAICTNSHRFYRQDRKTKQTRRTGARIFTLVVSVLLFGKDCIKTSYVIPFYCGLVPRFLLNFKLRSECNYEC